MILRIILTSLAFLLLAAHYSRADNTIFVIISLLIPFLFLIKKNWALMGLQILTYAAALVWIYSTYLLVQQRIEMGVSWTRLAIILLAVVGYTVFTGILLNSSKIKASYK